MQIINNVINHLQENKSSYILGFYHKVLDSHHKYALLHLNIKNFRYFESKYGIEASHEILLAISQMISSFIEEDEYVEHLYADNFVMLLRYHDIDTLVYDRMIKFVNDLYRIDDERIYRCIFCSIGIYQLEDKAIGFEEALNFANIARKESESIKKRSHNIEIFDEDIYHHYMNRIELEMKTADAYKNYEFIAYLQPKVDLETEKIISAEALLRWIDEDGHSIPVNDFLPILNKNGYIELVDLDIFDQICKRIDYRLKNQLKVVPISFNISKSAFYSQNILADYIKIFEKYDIPKKYIEIEFMESISLDDTERLKKIVSGFRDYGFSCFLDDFGNGYSSFNVLLNAPFEVVKMDRQFFLENLKGNNQLVIQTVVNLLHSLGMKVVAEGVELKEHIDYLKKCKCDYVQGYYYYRPMPIEEFENLFDKV